MDKRFARNIEDFVCENCNAQVTGDGYTNHCPNCLYSKHVDINPGDRASKCRGLMEPVFVETSRKGYIIVFRCKKCGATKRNRTAPGDNFEKLLDVANQVKSGGKSI
jgi:rubrerythrin